MAGTMLLTDKEEIRDWAASRVGFPAVVDVSPEAGTQPMIRLVFDQAAYLDTDGPERPANTGGIEHVEWDEWFRLFDEGNLALEVSRETMVKDSWHRLVKRDEEDSTSSPQQ